jgi:riboflavin biosynthesis pyrimidine reductase
MSPASATPDRATAAQGPALEVLFDPSGQADGPLRGFGMPSELERRYGRPLLVALRTDRPTVIANFVSTLDGIVALGGGRLSGGGLISGFHEPDRFVMGLLRALADVIVIGAGTLRGSSGHGWTAERVHPESAAAFAAWRAEMGLAQHPTTAVVTGSGDIPVEHSGLNDPSIPVVIATTPRGAERLRHAGLAPHVSIEPIGADGPLDADALVGIGASRGARLILTEGGPHVMGEFVRGGLLDELFLTLAPQVVGRDAAGRLGLVEGLALPSADARWHELVSLRRSADHLFLRYRTKES